MDGNKVVSVLGTILFICAFLLFLSPRGDSSTPIAEALSILMVLFGILFKCLGRKRQDRMSGKPF